MNKFCAYFRSFNEETKENQKFEIYFYAISFDHAEHIAKRINPKLEVTGRLVAEIDTEIGEQIDYDFDLN